MCVCVLPSAAGRQLSSGGKVRLALVDWDRLVAAHWLEWHGSWQLVTNTNTPTRGRGAQWVLGKQPIGSSLLFIIIIYPREIQACLRRSQWMRTCIFRSEFLSAGVDISCDSCHICSSKEVPHSLTGQPRHSANSPLWITRTSAPPAGQQQQTAASSFMGIIHTSLRLYSSQNFPRAMRSECWSSNGCSADPRRTPGCTEISASPSPAAGA